MQTVGHRSAGRRLRLALAAAALAVAAPAGAQAPASREAKRSGGQIWTDACIACHTRGGTPQPQALRVFAPPPPDLTDCNFTTREADLDWIAIVHDGGPARGFTPMMPAFGDALTDEEILRVVEYVRTFCTEPGWARGEFNLPRALFTEKAYPEDEWVLTTGVAAEGRGTVSSELVYEKRLSRRLQAEVVFPFTFEDTGAGGSGWTGGIGDLAVALKGVVFADLRTGSIVALTGEITFPTGDAGRGFGTGTWVGSPFLHYAQLFPANVFLQAFVGAELPFDTARAPRQGVARAALGQSFNVGRWGRLISPMVEALALRELTSGAPTDWDLVPQVQVTLSTRQHIRTNVGVRVPLYRPSAPTEIYVYLLWDFFDGGFLEGW